MGARYCHMWLDGLPSWLIGAGRGLASPVSEAGGSLGGSPFLRITAYVRWAWPSVKAPHCVWQAGQAEARSEHSSASCQLAHSLLLMTTESDAAVGRLAVMDGTLNDLLRDLVGEVTCQDAAGMTTGKAAQFLLGQARVDRALITPEARDWLKRVAMAAEKRNEAMHAVARDQCVLCGDATRFEHRGHPVDRPRPPLRHYRPDSVS